MKISARDKLLKATETTATLLGHELEPWQRDAFGYFTKCTRCGIEVRTKISLKLTTLTANECTGKRES